MKTGHILTLSVAICLASLAVPGKACTGITLKSEGGDIVVARTIEWGGSYLDSRYVVVPRGHASQSYVPGGRDGMKFTSRYGYVGLAVVQNEFVAEGMNEAGLAAGLFYFPGYGKYVEYDPSRKSRSIADLQLLSWLLGECATVDEVEDAVGRVRIVGIEPGASTVHWRFTDRSGRQVVLEIVDGVAHFYENRLGVLTNSPGFEWQMTNLNNYVNLYSGAAPSQKLGDVELAPFGAGSGFLGIPGDVTPPSRFVRAAFYQATARPPKSAEETVLQGFQILGNFDIPIGVEFSPKESVTDIPSATQWTAASDISNGIIYFRTMYDSRIRSIDIGAIDFATVKYQSAPLDAERQQRIYAVKIGQ